MSEKQTILIVDDDERNLRLLQAMLAREDYHIITASGGEEALKRVSEAEPDLILLDVMMPGIDGFEVCKRIKHQAETRIIPIVMVTALTEKEDRIRALKSGADDFLSKPVDKIELLLRVKSLLRIKAFHDSLVKSHDRIVAQNRKLSELEKFKEDLTHMLVHDLNNPLFSLYMAIETMLLERENLPEKHVDILNSCVENCQDLKELVLNILDVHKMEEDELKINRELVDVSGLIESTILLFKGKMEAKKIFLSCRNSNNVPPAEIDRSVIKRVVANLLGNAVRHTPPGGAIEINVGNSENGDISVSIKDSGDGIAPEFHQKIFDKFQQVDIKKAGLMSGLSGLGLPFCKMAVQAHGGAIWVESDGEGKGCTFSFTLPALAAATQSE